MKKSIKNLLVSVLSAAMFLFCGAATTVLTVSANEAIATETSGFTMLEGASIRLANPKGLRFIAEMGSQEYKALLTSEDGIEKKMGMFIMPYSYLSDPSKYVNGETDITEKNYEKITKRLDFVFYNSSDASVKNAIYEKDGYYRANGVIGDLYLHNYDTEFVGIAYIAETDAEGTNYTFADFNEKDNVRSAAYVASEAYADYSVQEVRDCFDEYICGGILENAGMTKNEDSTYTYKGTTYDSILAAATGASLNKESARVMAHNSITSYGFEKIGEDSRVTLNASTHNGEYATRQPLGGEVEDMSYMAFKGSYGLNDWVVFDFTGDNMPFVSFFNSEVTNTIYNQEYTAEEFTNKAYTGVSGWVIGNGIRTPNGSILGGVDYAPQNRLTLIGPNKITALYDNNTIQDVANVQTRSVISDFALSIKALQDSTDSYRIFMGFVEGTDSSKMNLVVHAIDLATGAVVVSDQSLSVAKCSVEGSIALHGQFGKETVLDKLYPIEEDTTLDALLAKYAYSEKQEESLSFENYAYAGPTNGQWYLDGEAQVAEENLVDFRTYEGLKAYKDAGFSIYCPQDSLLITDGTTYSDIKEVLDRAHNLGLKVVLMDNRIIQLSRPITITDDKTLNGTAWTVGASGKFATLDELDATLKGYISLYKNHPAFYGVMLGDEPSYQNAECYGMVYQALKRIMPEIYVQYNLLPLENSFSVVKYRYPGLENSWSWNADIEGAYKNYLSKFYEAMSADYIQIDDYAMKADGIDATYLRGLQIIAEFAKEKDIAVKIVAQTCAMQSNGELTLRGMSEADARWINNTLLGFGVKQINYFTYFTKVSNSMSGELFVDGESFVNHDGTKTDLYYFMQEIMAENQAFAPMILNFDYQGSKIYSNKYAFDSSHVTDVKSDSAFTHISNVTTSTDATLVTELCNDSNEYMYMLMNTIDPSKTGATTQTVAVTFKSVTTATVYKNGVAEKVTLTNNAYTVTLNAGDAVYIVLN